MTRFTASDEERTQEDFEDPIFMRDIEYAISETEPPFMQVLSRRAQFS